MKCVICKKEAVMLGETVTYEGYISPPGHNHDDNCVVRTYACSEGHRYLVSKRNRCPAEGCDWIGVDQCHCHGGKKVDEWPDSFRKKNCDTIDVPGEPPIHIIGTYK